MFVLRREGPKERENSKSKKVPSPNKGEDGEIEGERKRPCVKEKSRWRGEERIKYLLLSREINLRR